MKQKLKLYRRYLILWLNEMSTCACSVYIRALYAHSHTSIQMYISKYVYIASAMTSELERYCKSTTVDRN